MKMRAALFFVFFFVLMSVDSARDAFTPVANGNYQYMDDDLSIYELAKIFKIEAASLEISPAEFSHSCLEMARKAKEVLDDQILITELDTLARIFCVIAPSDLEAELRLDEACITCRSILSNMRTLLKDTEKQLMIIIALIKLCEFQTDADKCKELVLTYGPLAMTALQKIVNMDLCYMVRVCNNWKNETHYVNQMHISKFD
uniref:Proactivator polypeptide-like 1 n=1 Tax=Anthurium amnicola TaxID=1678845 RepID=A0A1D1ZEP4_9ARAE